MLFRMSFIDSLREDLKDSLKEVIKLITEEREHYNLIKLNPFC